MWLLIPVFKIQFSVWEVMKKNLAAKDLKSEEKSLPTKRKNRLSEWLIQFRPRYRTQLGPNLITKHSQPTFNRLRDEIRGEKNNKARQNNFNMKIRTCMILLHYENCNFRKVARKFCSSRIVAKAWKKFFFFLIQQQQHSFAFSDNRFDAIKPSGAGWGVI